MNETVGMMGEGQSVGSERERERERDERHMKKEKS